MNAAKTRAQKKGLEGKTRFFLIPDARVSEVRKLAEEKKYLESRSLSAALEKLFLVSISKDNDEQRFGELGKYIEDLRKKIDKTDKTPEESEVYLSGIKHERQAYDFFTNKDFEKSLEAYIQAASVYEKILLAIQSREGT
jgi:hypothetical protein